MPRGYKRFKCNRCGCQFVKRVTSPVARCIKCENGCLALGYKNRRLDVYSQMKLNWLRNPKEWEDNIKRRTMQNLKDSDKVYLNDSSGRRIGEMPEAIEI